MLRYTIGADETKASHEVMELVRGSAALSNVAFRLRENGLSWRDVKTTIDVETKKDIARWGKRPRKPMHEPTPRGTNGSGTGTSPEINARTAPPSCVSGSPKRN